MLLYTYSIVFRWCRSCGDLFIKVGNKKWNRGYPYSPDLEDPLFNRILNTALTLLRSHVIEWMMNLKSLVVLSYESPSSLESCILDRILSWLRDHNHHLEHLWLTDDGTIKEFSGQVMAESSAPVKSLVLDEYRQYGDPNSHLNFERFRKLVHLSGSTCHRLEHLPNLKFFRGTCDTGNDEVINNT